MKKSLSHLPAEKRDDLRFIAQCVVEELGDLCEMVILYGSYARGDYVEYDQRTEYGIRTYYMSDYDFLVITGRSLKYHRLGRALNRVTERYYRYKGYGKRFFVTQPQFIDDTIDDVNQALSKSRYFYSDIKKQGIMLYDSKRHTLARRRKLNFREIRDIGQEYFDEKFKKGCLFIENAVFNAGNKEYSLASFMLHQACENLYLTVILTFTLYADKVHNLEVLSGTAKTHALETAKVFPRSTKEEERIFNLIKEAYIQARYNSKFIVTKEDIEAALPQVELLRDIVKVVCEAKIAEYASRIRV